MNSAQESKNELQAAIRYAENAISAAQATIESIDFRQEMAKRDYMEKTGHEESLTKKVQELEYELTAKTAQAGAWRKEADALKAENAKLREDKERLTGLEIQLRDKIRELKEARGRAEGEVELLQGAVAHLEAQVNALEQPERATMPVIPKDVAIAIFREGVRSGINDAVSELEGQTINISESEYVGDFEVSFTRDIDLDDELDFDWMRDKVGQYNEEFVIDSLRGLCADKEFECRIHGIDDND
jgi:chromosome segregation ATPase